ncbi:hypothetical protein BACERE00185_00269 [Bacillus mobilis]|uniref:Uncharacterized protein n=1 Tax=Bacillus mobilis TaxID=2026190 RepID=A0A1Y5YXK4_9BACI|nr:hypothetical protein [Bacillus mobilis]SMD67899.1 hypothetical protein BACERE00185_00269 [Bacillus mobilis]
MRYARGKQLALYVCNGSNGSYKHFKEMRGAMGNLKIAENITLKPYCDVLDPTFKWHRETYLFGNCIEYGGDDYKYGASIPVKNYRYKSGEFKHVLH